MINSSNGQILHYSIFNHDSSKEWVTFIHGAGGSSAIWFKQIRAFQKHFNVLLIDLRGHGQSKNVRPLKKEKYNFEEIGNEVIEVLEHLKIKCTHFVGISMGTIVIRDISERATTLVKSMILAGATMKLNVRGQFLMRFGDTFKSLIPYLILYRLFAFIIMPKKSNSEARNIFIQEAKKLEQTEFKKWFGLVSQVNPLLSSFRKKETPSKTLYVMGAEDHMFLPSIKKLALRFSSSELIVVPNSGHVVNIEKPGEFNEICISFLSDNS